MATDVVVQPYDARFADLRQRIGRFPRVRLAATPTPLHEMPRLAGRLGGPRLFIKRDDLTGPGLGGNKVRNLEFRLARALGEGTDTLVVGLDLQSNSARQTVACGNRLGMRTILVLEGERPPRIQGNLLVDYLLGAEIRFAKNRAEQRHMLDVAAQEVRAGGRVPHILNDNPMFEMASALAYIDCTCEWLVQLAEQGVAPRAIYMCSGGKGQAGLVLAKRLLHGNYEVHCATATREHQVPERTAEIANRTAASMGYDVRIAPAEVTNSGDYVGDGYGIPSQAGNNAVREFAAAEGIILDPVYSGKCAAAMLQDIRSGAFNKDDVVLFIHTGGVPAIFTHDHYWV